MRRLLAFGSGAAIIGLVLLLVAFVESYFIVSQLQTEIANATGSNSNLILEDATVEAVFLGIMVALGYGLISQGLNGIRRQEMLEVEQTEEDQRRKAEVMAKITRDRAVEAARLREVRRVVTSKGAETTEEEEEIDVQPVAVPSPPPVRREPARIEQQASTVPSIRMEEDAPPTIELPPPENPKPPAESEPLTQGMGEQMSASWQVTPPVAQPIQQAEAVTAQTIAGVEPSKPETSIQEKPSGVVWESETPPALECVNAPPEPPEPSPEMTPVPPSEQPTGQEVPQVQVPPKRGRGRPKGSKSKKKLEDIPQESQQETPQDSSQEVSQ